MPRPDSKKILRQQDDFSPEFRVFVQEITPELRAGSFVRELKGFNSIQTAFSLQGVPTASVLFSNIDDRYFNKQRLREWPQVEAEASKRLVRKTLDLFSSDQLMEVNPSRRIENSLQQAFKVPGASNKVPGDLEGFSLNIPGNVGSRSAYTETYLNTLFDLGTSIDSTRVEGLISLGLMPRIFIDAKGRDGQIYAVFSGLISGVTDIYTAGAEMSIQLTCVGTTRMLELGEIYSLASISQLEQTIASQNIKESRAELYKSMVFAGDDGVEIIRKVVRSVQAMYCFDAQDDLREENQAVVTLDANEFFYQHRFWTVETSPYIQGNYEGTDTLRKVGFVKSLPLTAEELEVFLASTGTSTLPGQSNIKVRSFPGRTAGLGIQDGDPVDALRGKLLIDKRILEGPQANTFQFLIRQQFSLYQSQKTIASQILRKVADTAYYDLFEDPNGNIIFQIPKYNNFPAELTNTELIDVVGLEQSANLPISNVDGSGGGDGSPGLTGFSLLSDRSVWDYSPAPEFFPEHGHGQNYLITNGGGLNHWSLQENETELVTFVEVPSAPNLGIANAPETLVAIAATGRTNQPETRKLQRRFGLRSVTTQQLLLGRGFFSQRIRTDVLDAFALATLRILNSQAKGGAIGLLARPDLMVGKTVWVIERQRLYYITAVNNNLTRLGDQYQTVLTLSYGHDIADRIPQPWVEVRGNLEEAPTTEQTRQEQQASQTGKSLNARNRVTTNFPEQPVGQKGIERVFGRLQKDVDFTDGPNNTILISNQTFLNRMVDVTLVGRKTFVVRVHELVRPVLEATFAELRNRKLDGAINSIIGLQTRRVASTSNPNRPLSFHCWGIAVDVGLYLTRTGVRGPYKVGEPLQEMEPIAAVFKEFKWYWGGGNPSGFSPRDEIHFQWAFPEGRVAPKGYEVDETESQEGVV